MTMELKQIADGEVYDVVVVGAGGAGMSAALFAAIAGARVMLVEKTEYVGGTTAYSAGTTWIPDNPVGNRIAPDSRERAKTFLDLAVGERSPAAMRQAFIDHGGEAVAHIERHSHVKYQPRAFHPDYLSELEGSTLCGRAIEPQPFDGRKLGRHFSLIRPPIPEFTVLGGMMVDRDDVGALLTMGKSWKSFRRSLGIIARHGLDRLRYRRGTRLVMGNALVARQLYSLLERKVDICLNTRLEQLQQDEGGIKGLTLSQGQIRRRIVVRGGVIMASGGFNRHPQRRQELLPGIEQGWCPAAPGHTGEAQELALAAGGHFGQGALSHAFWAPVSVRQRKDGSRAVFPHFLMDRGKPGMITVDQQGRRFVNESTSYHLFGIGMQQAHRQAPAIPAYLITDAAGLKRYGLGMVRPGGKGLAPFLAEGYLLQGDSLPELARQLQLDPAVLAGTVGRFNEAARKGVDPDFRRGSTDYQRANGDAGQPGINPCLGALEQAPFYAVRLYPGDIGAATGLETDVHARVLDDSLQPIAGLYACGNDMQSIMGGTYPGPGITLGPGLTFAYLAAKHAVARAGVA
ncbi:FAD-dependent oxidoreductase [Zobellella iuensis]|uniref:FAD-dependent oxidoreductase n=1 Tax=Zobellella iuensis TaxID=2803811 RepID=A0ABS1QNL7_9GAMM|nr:FAD-dependent oxidoreductase [Zobellella iuensis]MBL1375884.1 FAD-dependent oxidoreductase [Zobellella iuensis]